MTRTMLVTGATSDQSAYVTGQTIAVNGGHNIKISLAGI